MFEGDCDNDDECKGNFKCGEYNCLDMNPDSSFSTGADCCYDPNDDNFNNQVNIKSYMTKSGPNIIFICQSVTIMLEIQNKKYF